MSHLTGQVAVVTGASRGIGRAVATRLGALGARVVVGYVSDAGRAEEVVASIRAAGSDAVAVKADVTQSSEVALLMDRAHEHFGRLDHVVANAGIDFGLGPVVDVSDDDADRILAANVTGAFTTLRAAARSVDPGGSITFVGSAATLAPVAGFGLYAASKLPGTYLAGVLARELGPRGVRVNSVLPVAVDGAGYFAVDEPGDELRTAMEGASPLGARMGTVDDVADAVEYLTGPLAAWVSGQQLVVSGALV